MSTLMGSEINPAEGHDITHGFHTDFNSNLEKDLQEDIEEDIEKNSRDNGGEKHETTFSHFFKKGEIVKIKICRISKENYEFWKIYDANISLSNNRFFTFVENSPSNIPGALGYWGAWSKAERAITIE